MDRFVDVLGETEIDPSRTNDLKGTDFFYILENFIQETLSPLGCVLTKRQLGSFLLALEKYLLLEPEKESDSEEEISHLERRGNFCTKVEKKQWVVKLREKWESMDWE